MKGKKRAAFEIIEQLGQAPDIFALPVGNAGNITAYWKGFCEAYEHQLAASRPQVWGFEAEGAAAIVKNQVIEEPETFATAIRIGNPASWQQAVMARDESKGIIDMVSEEEIREAYFQLAEQEGIFCEPASAASVAGVYKLWKQGKLPEDSTIVAVLTGNGLKDPTSAMERIQEQPKAVEGTEEELLQRIFVSGGM